MALYAAKRKAARSGGLDCKVCGQRRPLVEHHIHGRAVAGAEMSWNKAWLCPSCHDEVHLGRVIIEGWVSTTSGKILAWRRAGRPQEALEGARPHLYSDAAAKGA